MRSRKVIALDFGRRRFRAVQAVRGRERLTIRRAIVEDLPADLEAAQPDVIGAWAGQRLDAAGFGRGRATVAIAREHVGLKRITLPTTDDSELAEMTRLAMQRELPFDAETAVIDFVPVERGEMSTTVLAVAVPRNVIDDARRMARAAGFRIERIALRTMGAAALINGEVSGVRSQMSGNGASDTALPIQNPKSKIQNLRHPSSDFAAASGVAIDITGEGVELAVVAGGSTRFSRAAEVPQPQDQLAIADAVVTETRRTWMSYRVGDDAAPVERAIIMGERRVSRYAAGPVAEMLKIPVEVLESHPRIDANRHEMDHVWPLAGLLLEPMLGMPLIDFARPRKAPDPVARARTRRLLAAGFAIVALLAGWTIARRDLEARQILADRLQTQQKEGVAEYARYWRDHYRLDHLERWGEVGVDWLKHASYLAEIAPPPDQVVFDSWTGTLQFEGVSYDPKTGKWSASQEMVIVIDGEARDRETADAFRGALMKNPVYTASTTGADAIGGRRMPFGFTYRLRTKVHGPVGTEGQKDKETLAGASAAAADFGFWILDFGLVPVPRLAGARSASFGEFDDAGESCGVLGRIAAQSSSHDSPANAPAPGIGALRAGESWHQPSHASPIQNPKSRIHNEISSAARAREGAP